MESLILVGSIVVGVIILLLSLWAFLNRNYIRIAPNTAAVIFGRKNKSASTDADGKAVTKGYRLITGGGVFKIPFFEEVKFMDLSNRMLSIKVDDAPNKDGVMTTIEGNANVKFASDKGLLEMAVENIEKLRNTVQEGSEKLFDIGVYITFFANNKEDLSKIESKIKNILEQQLIYAKPTIFREFEGMESSLPLGMDRLLLTTPLNSQPASTLFPFSSLDLSDSKGILYGVNLHNNSLIIFDRFTLPNANMVVFAQTGAGKSYAIKLEILRSLLLGTNVLIIDPENEYEYLADSIGGSYFKISVASDDNINPFELPVVKEDETGEEVFRNHILNLIGLIKLMLKGLTPQEELMLDRAIVQTYASRDIFPENIGEKEEFTINGGPRKCSEKYGGWRRFSSKTL